MIDIGDVYPASINVRDQNGNLVTSAPTTFTLTITQPDGTTVNPAVTFTSPGLLSASFLVAQGGRHLVAWLTTGPNTAYNDVFDATPQPSIGIVSLADAKRQLGIDPTETDDDDELRSWIAAMTDPMERFKNEVVIYRSFTATFRARHAWKFRLPPAGAANSVPVVTLDSLTITNWGLVTTVVTSPIPAGQLGSSFTWYVDPDTGLGWMVQAGVELSGMVTAQWHAGFTVMPQHYINGCMMLLQELWQVRRGPGGVGGVIGPEELGRFAQQGVLPRKVKELLGAPRPVVY